MDDISRLNNPEPGTGLKVARNTVYNTLGRVWFLVIGIFLTPYIVEHIGVERYAVWALVGVVTNYFGLLDFGIGTSFVKYISEFYTNKDYKNINKIINTGFFSYLVFAACILASAYFLLDPMLALLKVPAILYDEARFVFFTAIIVFCASNAIGVFIAVLSGLQRMDITNKIAVYASAAAVAGTVFAIERGYGLRGLIINNAVVFMLNSVMYVAAAYKLLPQIRFRIFDCDMRMFRRMFSFGFKVQVSHISGTITAQTDKILITVFLAIGLVTYYQLGAGVINSAMALPAILVSALIPAFSEIEARGERSRLIESYLRSTKYLSFLTIPLFVFVAVSAERIMFVWMGLGYSMSAVVIRILAAAYLINMLARVSGALCMAIEKPGYMMNASIIMIFSNIGLSVLFIKLFGFSGAAWGTFAAVNLGTVFFMWRLHEYLDISLGKYAGVSAPFLFSSLISGGCLFLLDIAISGFLPGAGRAVHLSALIISASVFLAIYLVCVKYSGAFSDDDSDFLKEKMPFLRGFLGRFLNCHG